MDRSRLERLLDDGLAFSLHTYLNPNNPPDVGFLLAAFSYDGTFRVIGNNPDKASVIAMLRTLADSLEADTIGHTIGHA